MVEENIDSLEHLKNAHALLVILGDTNEAKIEIDSAEKIGIQEKDEEYYYTICAMYEDFIQEIENELQEIENEIV